MTRLLASDAGRGTAVPRHQSLQQMAGDGQLLCESIAEQSQADGDS
jgi:hypothetical protein